MQYTYILQFVTKPPGHRAKNKCREKHKKNFPLYNIFQSLKWSQKQKMLISSRIFCRIVIKRILKVFSFRLHLIPYHSRSLPLRKFLICWNPFIEKLNNKFIYLCNLMVSYFDISINIKGLWYYVARKSGLEN